MAGRGQIGPSIRGKVEGGIDAARARLDTRVIPVPADSGLREGPVGPLPAEARPIVPELSTPDLPTPVLSPPSSISEPPAARRPVVGTIELPTSKLHLEGARERIEAPAEPVRTRVAEPLHPDSYSAPPDRTIRPHEGATAYHDFDAEAAEAPEPEHLPRPSAVAVRTTHEPAPSAPRPAPEPPRQASKVYRTGFVLPGTQRKLFSGCYLEYKGSTNDEYAFTLHRKGGKPDAFILKSGESVTKTFRISNQDIQVDFCLTSTRNNTKSVSVQLTGNQKLVNSLLETSGGFGEFWANLRIAPYARDFAAAAMCVVADVALVTLGADLLKPLTAAITPFGTELALAGLVITQAVLIGASAINRARTLDREAAKLEVKS